MKYFYAGSQSWNFIGLIFSLHTTLTHAFEFSSSQKEKYGYERGAKPLRRVNFFQYHQHIHEHSSLMHRGRPKLLIDLGPDESTKSPAFSNTSFDTSLLCINDSTWRYDNEIGSDGLKRDCEHVLLIATGVSLLDFDFNICERVGGIEHNGKTVYDACCVCGGGLRVGRDEPSEFTLIDELPSNLETNLNTNPSLSPTRNTMDRALNRPSSQPSPQSLMKATIRPSLSPTLNPSWLPSVLHTQPPTETPTTVPSKQRTLPPTRNPSFLPSTIPSVDLSSNAPSNPPSMHPSSKPSLSHNKSSSSKPTANQSLKPSTAFDVDVCRSYSTRW